MLPREKSGKCLFPALFEAELLVQVFEGIDFGLQVDLDLRQVFEEVSLVFLYSFLERRSPLGHRPSCDPIEILRDFLLSLADYAFVVSQCLDFEFICEPDILVEQLLQVLDVLLPLRLTYFPQPLLLELRHLLNFFIVLQQIIQYSLRVTSMSLARCLPSFDCGFLLTFPEGIFHS